jgi:superfamily I DNA/RNA helicase
VLTAFTRAPDFISYLRGPGGLDEFFGEHERTFGGTDQIDIEVLQDAEREAANLTVDEYSELLGERGDRLRAVRDDVNGIELTTIHRAKGRQWPEVHVFARRW